MTLRNAAPVSSIDSAPNNLPIALTRFVGRTSELTRVVELLATERLVTLTGTGGVGKTRLALRVAAGQVGNYAAGAWWVDLATTSDAELIVGTVGRALGLRDEPGRPLRAHLLTHLASRRALVVFDNCEHLLDGVAHLIEELLGGGRELRILATSREPLGVPGETVFLVPTLSTPDRADASSIESSDAVQLFVERARCVRPDFSLTADSAPVVADICRRLDGLPLAVELAAARTRVMSLDEINAGIDRRFRLLTGGSRTALPRQRTLAASVAWSHDLLTISERALFRRLSVFVGTFTLAAAERIVTGDGIDTADLLDLMTSLVDKSLVIADHESSVTRYRLLETIAEYGRDRLAEAGNAEQCRDRHLDYYIAFAETLEPQISRVSAQVFDLIDAEKPNLRAALEWATSRGGSPEQALRLVAPLFLMWELTGAISEGQTWHERVLALAEDSPSALTARVRCGLAYIAFYAGEFEKAIASATDALATARALGDDAVAARALGAIGPSLALRDPAAGRTLLQESLALAREVGDDWCAIGALGRIAFSWLHQDRYADARVALDEADTLVRRTGIRWWAGWNGAGLAQIGAGLGDFVLAVRAGRDGLAASRELGERVGFAYCVPWLVLALIETGEVEPARRTLTEAERWLEALGGPIVAYMVELAHSWLARAEGRPRDAGVHADRALRAGRLLGMEVLIVRPLVSAGESALAAGDDVDLAQAALAEGLAIAGRIDNRPFAGRAELGLATVARLKGNLDEAEGSAHRALVALYPASPRWAIPALEMIASLAADRGRPADAARVLSASRSWRENMGLVGYPDEVAHLETEVARIRADLGAIDFAAAWSEGREMDPRDAVARVQRMRGKRGRPSSGWNSLTPAELDVVRLVARGLTNPEVAARLHIARETVKSHLVRVFAKLRVTSRTELAAVAARAGIESGESA